MSDDEHGGNSPEVQTFLRTFAEEEARDRRTFEGAPATFSSKATESRGVVKDNKIVRLKKSQIAALNEEAAESSARLRESLAVAKLAVMPLMQYEQERLKSAKELGWRPSFLDKLVEEIRNQVALIGGRERPNGVRTCEELDEDLVGEIINVHYDDGTMVHAILLTRFKSPGKYEYEYRDALLLTDGSGRVITGFPFKGGQA